MVVVTIRPAIFADHAKSDPHKAAMTYFWKEHAKSRK